MGRCPGAQMVLGDGKTQFFLEARCAKFTSAPSHLCKGHRDAIEDGRIDELIPETSRIFGPTAWFLESLKACGAPPKEVFKRALEAHKQVVESMTRKKSATAATAATAATKQQSPSLSFIELDECIDVKEIRTITLKPMSSTKKKQVLKDEINGYLFDKFEGKLTLSSPNPCPSPLAKATTQERAAVEAH